MNKELYDKLYELRRLGVNVETLFFGKYTDNYDEICDWWYYEGRYELSEEGAAYILNQLDYWYNTITKIVKEK